MVNMYEAMYWLFLVGVFFCAVLIWVFFGFLGCMMICELVEYKFNTMQTFLMLLGGFITLVAGGCIMVKEVLRRM